jgi:hypothetical protein
MPWRLVSSPPAPPDADSGAEPVRVEYDAPASCPAEEAFWAAVTARTPKVRRGEEGAAARTFSIKLVAGGDESTEHLVVRALDGSTTEREVAGDTQDCLSQACDGVSFVYVSSQCADHRIDGNETDIDCGGSACGPCAIGMKCTTNFDRQTGYCAGYLVHVCD